MLKKNLLVTMMAFSFNSLGQDCPPVPYGSNVLPCPLGRVKLLDGRYPNVKYSVQASNIPFAQQVVLKILKGHQYKIDPQMPLEIAISGNQNAFNEVSKSLEDELAKNGITPDKIKEILGQLRHDNSSSFLYDPKAISHHDKSFSSFDDMGRPTELISHSFIEEKIPDSGGLREKYLKANEKSPFQCVSQGNPIKDDIALPYDDKIPGNFVPLPGGGCLVTDRVNGRYLSQVCDSLNIVKMDNQRFKGLMLDSLFKVVPLNPAKEPLECSFALMVSSPKEAIDVIEKNKDDTSYFFESDLTNIEERKAKISKMFSAGKLNQICDTVGRFQFPREKKSSPPNLPSGGKSSFLRKLFDELTIQDVYSQSTSIVPDCIEKLVHMTNKDFYDFIQDPYRSSFKSDNMLVQKVIDKAKTAVIENIKNKLPNCNFEVLDIPAPFNVHNFFNPALPPAVNSLVANDTIILPKNPNGLFNKAINEKLDKTGLKIDTIDTWDYPFSWDKQGVHAKVKTYPYCRLRYMASYP